MTTSQQPQSKDWTVTLAKEGTPLATFQKIRTDAISEMFDNVDEYGIYPTTRFFAKLDAAVSTLLAEERSRIVREVEGRKGKS